jgi:hypothetical protein
VLKTLSQYPNTQFENMSSISKFIKDQNVTQEMNENNLKTNETIVSQIFKYLKKYFVK